MANGIYYVDGKPVHFTKLINMAQEVDPEFGRDGVVFTSAAAMILREAGHTVMDYQPEDSRHD